MRRLVMPSVSAIDRLAQRQVSGLAGIEHFRMDDLQLLAIGVELAGDELGLAERQSASSPSPDC